MKRKMKKPHKRIDAEKRTVERMVRLYCSKKEENTSTCNVCEELILYAHKRLSACPFGENKPTCKRCSIHCYRPDMRERMRAVMRYAGPHMLFHHPIDTLKHAWQSLT